MNTNLINTTSIKLGEVIAQLQELQRFYDDPSIDQLLGHVADYQEKLVTASHQLTATSEQAKQAA
ncbi:MAG: hypothetical protein WBG70_18410 [Spirulinaceae cyanobacterium]